MKGQSVEGPQPIKEEEMISSPSKNLHREERFCLVAHELIDIFTIICGYSELSLETLTEGTKEKKNLKKVLAAADRGIEMIGNYFSASERC